MYCKGMFWMAKTKHNISLSSLQGRRRKGHRRAAKKKKKNIKNPVWVKIGALWPRAKAGIHSVHELQSNSKAKMLFYTQCNKTFNGAKTAAQLIRIFDTTDRLFSTNLETVALFQNVR